MKKIILAISILAFSFGVKAQSGNLDTVSYNLPAMASEWAYYISYMNGSTDSTDIAFVREVRTKLQSTPNLNWNTVVTMDNLKGKYIITIYNIGNRIPAGEALQLGVSVLNTIKAIPNNVLQYYIGSVDAVHSTEFDRHRKLGKNMLID